jgi:hypothetical protein
MDDSGYWITGKGTSDVVKWFPYETKSDVRDNLGGYGTYTTPGWKGDTAVWTARSFTPTKDVKAVSKYTITKVGRSKYNGAYTFTDAKGTVVGGKDVCTKSYPKTANEQLEAAHLGGRCLALFADKAAPT